MSCNICSYQGAFELPPNTTNLRESLVCPDCKSNSRDRALIHALGLALGKAAPVRDWPPNPSFRIFETTGYRGYPQFFATKFDYYNTKYDPAKITEGADPRHYADVQSMPYADNFFDCVLSSDVFEHVRLDDQAFREVFRVLRPGGVFVLQAPYGHSIKTRILVQPDGDKDVFLEPPQYHAEETLVYRIYGHDLLERLHNYGFSVCRLHMALPEFGVCAQDTFVMRKGPYLEFIST